MVKRFLYKGHKIEVVPIEGSTDYNIIRDGKQTRRVCKEIGENAINNIDRLFKQG